MRKKENKKKKHNKTSNEASVEEMMKKVKGTEKFLDYFYESRKTIQELIAPIGVNPNPLGYMIIDDNGVSLYTMCLYIDKLPTNATFSTTFSSLFNFPSVTSTVFINPLVGGASSKQLDRRINNLDTERIGAEEAKDRNRYRRLSSKIKNTEQFAQDVEGGSNLLYDVAFLFVLQGQSLDELKRKLGDFHMLGREKGIELCACYSVHPEAFVSSYPTNRIFTASSGILRSNILKKHKFDKYSLCDIFNHTQASFSHKNGIVVGRNMNTLQPILFDIFDDSHLGYGVICTGKTGSGKSATLKIWLSRFADFGCFIRSIDFEPVPGSSIGEYSIMTEELGGVNFQIKQGSENIINVFETTDELEYDRVTGAEMPKLYLSAKKVDAKNLLLIMIKNGHEIETFKEITQIEYLVKTVINDLYEEREIYDGEVESLYTQDKVLVEGEIGVGRVKKILPTITDFFKRMLIKQKENTLDYYKDAYQLILDAMSDYVKELYYCPECLTFYTKEEYEKLCSAGKGHRTCGNCKTSIIVVKGSRSYYDGQSTVNASIDTVHINIDISQLPKDDRTIALLVGLNYLNENHIKKNSMDPRKVRNMILLIDELHKTFPYKEARELISDGYRTYRKRHVAPIAATQALADFKGYPETEAIIKNSTTKLLMKQDFQDRKFIKDTTPLTDSQVERLLKLGGNTNDLQEDVDHKGEICLIDNDNVVFLKVDYLTDSEARIVETDAKKIAAMYKGTSKSNYEIKRGVS